MEIVFGDFLEKLLLQQRLGLDFEYIATKSAGFITKMDGKWNKIQTIKTADH